MSSKSHGTVKFFSNVKGWGIITSDAGDECFVHYSNIAMSGYKKLVTDDQVEFDQIEGDKGYQATNVRIIDY